MSADTSPLLTPIVRLINRIDSMRQTDYRARLISWKTGFHSSSYRFSTDQVAFVHIPKTGGTSISAILEQIDHQDRFVNLHMHRPISQDCPPQNYQYITMLRHPVDRVYSYYRMAQRNDSDNPYSHLCGQGLEHFLTHCWETRNMCCRYLAGAVKKEANEQSLGKACNNLLNFSFIGLFEEFEHSIDQLLEIFSTDKVKIPHHRQSPRATPSPEEYSLIEKYNQYDLRLYEFFLEERDRLNHS